MKRGRAAALVLFGAAALGRTSSAENPVTTFPPPPDSADWSALLSKYVDGRGRVDYARWKGDAADRRRLAAYLARLAPPAPSSPGDDANVATLVNAYNAFIVETVLERYPVEGVRSIPGAFTAVTHAVGDTLHSLDEIEHTAVRLGGYRVHAALVCASRSCPPLDRRAFSGRDLSAREDERMRAWMARADLYRFEPERNTVFVPRYFDWYRADFEKAGVARVLATYAPERYRAWLAGGSFRLAFLDYDWGLNDRDRAGEPRRPE